MNTDFELSNLTNLESVYIGAGSFFKLKSLSHNPKLKIFETEDGYEDENSICDCAFINVNKLELSSK